MTVRWCVSADTLSARVWGLPEDEPGSRWRLYDLAPVPDDWLRAMLAMAPESIVLPTLGLAAIDTARHGLSSLGGLARPLSDDQPSPGAREWCKIARGLETLLAGASPELPSSPVGPPGAYDATEAGTAVDQPSSAAERPGFRLAAINLSMAPHPLYEPGLGCLVSRALARTARRVLPVVAVGNEGGLPGRSLVSGWARAEGVLAVGATEDAEGTRLAPYSSRGCRELRGTGPDLVAFGTSALDSGVKGTSFAGPRIARCAALATCALLELRRALLQGRGRTPSAQRVGIGLIDVGAPASIRGTGRFDASIHLVDETLAKALALTAEPADIDRLDPGPQTVRRLLLDCARPMPGYTPHQVGAGFLSPPVLADALGSMTLSRLWANVGGDPKRLCARFRDERPFATEALRTLCTHGSLVAFQQFWDASSGVLYHYGESGTATDPLTPDTATAAKHPAD